MAHRVFGVKPAENEADREPITFDLGGETGIAVRHQVNGKLLLELVSKSDSPNAATQVEGMLQIFDVSIRTDDGEYPELYTGKRWDRMRPLQNHTQAELDAIDDENEDIADQNDEIRERNDKRLAEGREAGTPEADIEDELEDLLEIRRPGIDPTSSWGRLTSVLDDPNTRIQIEELMEVSGWIVEQVVGRPTQRSGGSRRGGQLGNRSSRRAQRSRD